MNLSNLTIKKVNQGLKNKEFSAVELTKAYLKNIAQLDKEISAYIEVTEEMALKKAKEVDILLSKEKEIPLLAGVPIAVKDNILVENVKCTAGSKILENYIAPYDATVIKKLKKEKVVILGKTNLDEFAMGSSCENSAFFITKNPCDRERVPGGSSGGSTAAVKANMCLCALGSDTGGSIRLPASFCGVVGLKPTYGTVSRYGLIAMASSLDQIGPIGKCVEDVKILFEKICGRDELDSTSVDFKFKPLEDFDIKNIKIGVPKEYFIEGIDKEVEKIIKESIKKFEREGAKIEEISLPHTQYALPVYYILMPCEVSANLARYDGIRYGKRSEEGEDLMDIYLNSRGEWLGDEVKRRIMLGTYSLSAGYWEEYYLRAQKVRTLIIRDFKKAFEKVDVILTPTSPTPAFKIGEKKDPLSMYLCDIFMVAVSLAGLPALSIPCGEVGNLPVGLQIIGKEFEENLILKLGEIFEKI